MPNFKYKARDKFSRLVTGITPAAAEIDAAKKLQDMGYIPISIEEIHELGVGEILKRFRNVKLEELNVFTRQLYALQKAGVPLLSSLEAIAQQAKNKYFKNVIEEISHGIRSGLSFSGSLKEHSNVFGDIYVSMIKAAESSGNMVNILESLSNILEQDIDTRSRIKSATRYPMLALLVLCIGFLIVVTFVIPRFAVIYSQFNTVLPLPTRILIFVNLLLKKFWFLFIIALIAAIFVFKKFIKSSLGRPIWDNFKLRVPIFGELISMLIMSRFTKITSLLMKSGVGILEILDLTANTSGNIIIARAIRNIKDSVNQGRGISEPMRVSGLFPGIVVQMVAIGEQSGKIDELLLSVSDYYDRESGYMIKNLSTYIEPILIFILALMVLVMALAIFLPMWNLIRLFRPS